MARKRSSDEGGGYSWMDTYGDMVTLLLTFFIMLFSMSSVDSEKWEVLVKAFSRNQEAETQQIVMIPAGDGDNVAAAQGEYDLLVSQELDTEHERPVDLNELYEYLKAYVDENGMSASVSVEKDSADNVYLRFDNNIFFAGNSSVLRQESFPILQFLGECLKSVEDQVYVLRVSGHTATIQGNEAQMVNDWDLSSARANSVANFFEEQTDFEPKKLMTNGWGRNHPRYPNDTEENRAKNRRVEIMVLGNDFDTGNAQQMYDMLQKMVEAGPVEGGTTTEEDPGNGADVIGAERGPDIEASASDASGSEALSGAEDATASESSTTEPEAPSSSTAEASAASGASGSTASAPAALTEEQIRNMTASELEQALGVQ